MRVEERLCMTMVEDVRAMRNEIIRYTTGTYPGSRLSGLPGGVIPRAAPPDLLQLTSILKSNPAQFALLVKWKESGYWRWVYNSKVLT